MEETLNFDDFIKDWQDGYTGFKPAYIRERGVSKSTEDAALPVDGEISDTPIPKYRNIWEFLESNKFKREVIDTIDIKFDNVNNIVKKLDVTFINGDSAGFEDIQLEER